MVVAPAPAWTIIAPMRKVTNESVGKPGILVARSAVPDTTANMNSGKMRFGRNSMGWRSVRAIERLASVPTCEARDGFTGRRPGWVRQARRWR
jgi:hypothetical protein